MITVKSVNVILIQGVFFFVQRGKKYLLRSYHFSGAIFPDADNGEVLSGRLADKFGESKMTDIVFGEDGFGEKVFMFTKTYPGQPEIKYFFKKSSKHPDIWVGEYEGKKVGKGRAHCLATTVTEDFLNPCL